MSFNPRMIYSKTHPIDIAIHGCKVIDIEVHRHSRVNVRTARMAPSISPHLQQGLLLQSMEKQPIPIIVPDSNELTDYFCTCMNPIKTKYNTWSACLRVFREA
jgi:hypothetical protein